MYKGMAERGYTWSVFKCLHKSSTMEPYLYGVLLVCGFIWNIAIIFRQAILSGMGLMENKTSQCIINISITKSGPDDRVTDFIHLKLLNSKNLFLTSF